MKSEVAPIRLAGSDASARESQANRPDSPFVAGAMA